MKFENIQVISWDIYSDNHSSEKNISHSILIPNYIMESCLNNKTDTDNPILFIEIKDMNDNKITQVSNSLVFGNIEVTDADVCVLPFWAMSKLQLLEFGKVSIENANFIKKIGFIKLKANISNYVYWEDIKKILENELENYRCLSVEDVICIADVEFYVTELRDIDSIIISNGSLFNTEPSIEFDVPTDIEYFELLNNTTLQNQQIYVPRTIEELENEYSSNSSALSYTLTFHTGEEIKILEKHYAEQKLMSATKNKKN